jgi:hypothetical protein
MAMPAARADVGLMIEQPYGKLGGMSPTGHSAIYLSRVCAETPTHLRRCRPGENGVVISRYSSIGHYDWVAIPLLPYLYAVDDLRQIPSTIDALTLARLRDNYRREHLEGLVPDGANEKMPRGRWTELIGAAYIREIFVYEMETTPAQDDRLIHALNTRPNKSKFNYFFRNCANFSESILNFYYPHAVHRSFTADLGLVTPKQIAKSFESYSHAHSDLRFSIFEIPQVPGKIERSGKIYGVVEALIKKKQYVIPIVILHPYFAAALVGTYFTRGRFNPAKHAVMLDRSATVEALLEDQVPVQNMEVRNVEQPAPSKNHRHSQPLTTDCSSMEHCSSVRQNQSSSSSGDQ